MLKVLMIGAGRQVRGGVSSVVNSYYDAGLDRKVELCYLPTMQDGSKLTKLLVAAFAYVRFCCIIKTFDILHVHMSSDKSFYRKALFIRRAFAAGRRIIIHMHGSTFDLFFKERCTEEQREYVREIFGLAETVIALSEDWKSFLGEHVCDPDKIRVIYNSVPVPDSGDRDYSDCNLLFLGILGQRKGAYDLMKLLPAVFERFPGARAYFCGDGDRAGCEKLAAEAGIGEQVSFPGWVRGEEKEKYLRECSIFLLPTYNEGMPMSVLEAMSHGLCVISTRVGGIPHIIRDGENGLLSEPGDTEAVAENILRALGDEQLKERLGRAARETVKKDFDISVNIERLLEVYEAGTM